MNGLQVARVGQTTGSIIERFPRIADLGIRCSLPFWLQRIEFSTYKNNYRASYSAYDDQFFQRLAVLNSTLDFCLSGFIMEIVPDGRHLHYVCTGPQVRIAKALHNSVSGGSTQVFGAYIDNQLLDNATNFYPTAFRNMDITTGNQLGANFTVNAVIGTSYTDIIKELLTWGDSSYNIWDFWFSDIGWDLINGVQMYQGNLQPRANNAAYDFYISDYDREQVPVGRHMWNYQSRSKINYGTGSSVTSEIINSEAESKYWPARVWETQSKMDATVAADYAQQKVNFYSEPIRQEAVLVTSPTIRHRTRGKVPTYYLLSHPQVFRLEDRGNWGLSGITFGGAQEKINQVETLFCTGVDYDYKSGKVRLVPNSPDARLDAMLARSAINEFKNEMVQRFKPGQREDSIKNASNRAMY